jgi:hypothetical protein
MKAVTGAERVKPSRVGGSMSWSVAHCQFEAVTEHKWTDWGKATNLLAVMQRQSFGVPARQAYENIVEALEARYRDHRTAAVYLSQLKSRAQLCKSVRALSSSWSTGHLSGYPSAAFRTSMQNREMKHRHLMGGFSTRRSARP